MKWGSGNEMDVLSSDFANLFVLRFTVCVSMSMHLSRRHMSMSLFTLRVIDVCQQRRHSPIGIACVLHSSCW